MLKLLLFGVGLVVLCIVITYYFWNVVLKNFYIDAIDDDGGDESDVESIDNGLHGDDEDGDDGESGDDGERGEEKSNIRHKKMR